METALDRLLDNIRPERTTQEVSRLVDMALATFTIPARIDRWEVFVGTTVHLCLQVETAILNPQGGMPDMDLSFYWGLYRRFLVAAFGRNGDKAAFELARTGNEGGYYTVATKIAEAIVRDYSGNWIKAHVWSYWNGLSNEDKYAAADEFLAKCGHLLPWELTEGSAGRVRANLPVVLIEYPQLLESLRRVGRDH